MYLYAVWNKKNSVYEDFMLYDSGNDLIDDLNDVKEHFEHLPNYLNYPDDYDLYRIAVIDSFDFTKPATAVHQYRGCMSEVLKKNYMDRSDLHV